MSPKVLNKREKYRGTEFGYPVGPGGQLRLREAVYCGRGSVWGNPFIIGRDGSRDEVCDRFEREVLPTLDVRSLRGKDLVCWCAPERCHCDSILKKANA